jgi:hypothetical protein
MPTPLGDATVPELGVPPLPPVQVPLPPIALPPIVPPPIELPSIPLPVEVTIGVGVGPVAVGVGVGPCAGLVAGHQQSPVTIGCPPATTSGGAGAHVAVPGAFGLTIG